MRTGGVEADQVSCSSSARLSSSSSRRFCKPRARKPSAIASMSPLSFRLTPAGSRLLAIEEEIVFAAPVVDFFLEGSYELLNKLRYHQALPEALENHSFQQSAANALSA
jgi:hypothetical protein